MEKLLTIGEASKELGVSISTLRRWDNSGKLKSEKTVSGHRRYDIAKLKPNCYRNEKQNDRKTVAYARVSGQDQKNDLDRQKQALEMYCAKQGWTYDVVSDLGSGMSYQKKGLKSC